jgi:hypothetical protein
MLKHEFEDASHKLARKANRAGLSVEVIADSFEGLRTNWS